MRLQTSGDDEYARAGSVEGHPGGSRSSEACCPHLLVGFGSTTPHRFNEIPSAGSIYETLRSISSQSTITPETAAIGVFPFNSQRLAGP
jgi:hypothetical protein